MKTDKPERIHIEAHADLRGKGGFYMSASGLLSACKQLEKGDFITLDGSYCYPVATLKSVMESYQRDSIVYVHPVVGWMRNSEFSAGSRYCKDAGDFTAVYNVLELRERMSGNRHPEESKQCIYSVSRDVAADRKSGTPSHHIAELTTDEVNPAPVSDPWVDKARTKKPDMHRPDLDKYMQSAGDLATDGFRLHYSALNCFTARDVEWDRKSAWEFLERGRKNPNVVTLDKPATMNLITACKQAMKIKADSIYLSINGKLEYSADNYPTEINGQIEGGYSHDGKDMRIRINAKYLLDALDKPAATTIKFNAPGSPVYITDGTHEAIVMPMHIDDKQPA